MALPGPTRLLLAAAVLAVAGGAWAQSTDWSRLSPQQRGVLAPLQRDWATVAPAQQQKWVELASRYPALPAAEQQRVQQRMAEWSRMTPQDRARARLNFQEARTLDRTERQQRWEAYRALPPEQRRELAEQARTPSRAPQTTAGRNDNAKSNVVRPPVALPARPVGPTVVQRGPGATTSLVSKPAAPPLHQQAGLPKVAATPGFVDDTTLLPRRGAQGAAVRSPGSEPAKAAPQGERP